MEIDDSEKAGDYILHLSESLSMAEALQMLFKA